jgi:acyl-coenzyme A thioesterase PaaI-like protein
MTHPLQGASGFIGWAKEFSRHGLAGAIVCDATSVHLGRSSQVWDAEVRNEANDRRLAVFRCTQMILWPRP